MPANPVETSVSPTKALHDWARVAGQPGDPRRIPLVRAALECVDDSLIVEEDREVVEAVRRYVGGLASVDDVYEARRRVRSSLMCPAVALAIMVYGIRPWDEVSWICYQRGHAHCAGVMSRHTGLDIQPVKDPGYSIGLLDVLRDVFAAAPPPEAVVPIRLEKK